MAHNQIPEGSGGVYIPSVPVAGFFTSGAKRLASPVVGAQAEMS